MIEHDRDQETEDTMQTESTGRRGCSITGLSDLLPDWLLPPEGKQHARNARKEALLAMKSILDAAIARQEAGPSPRRTAQRIQID
jgi:hypothetical protein